MLTLNFPEVTRNLPLQLPGLPAQTEAIPTPNFPRAPLYIAPLPPPIWSPVFLLFLLYCRINNFFTTEAQPPCEFNLTKFLRLPDTAAANHRFPAQRTKFHGPTPASTDHTKTGNYPKAGRLTIRGNRVHLLSRDPTV